jgi:pilus assembly protein Flp/PilA
MLTRLKRFIVDEAGATAIEYALILVLVALGLIASLTVIGDSLSTIFNVISTTLQSAAS